MNLWQRYRRLSVWNRLGAWGSISSIMSIPLAVVLFVASVVLAVRLANLTVPSPANMAGTSVQDMPAVQRRAPAVTFADGRRATVGFTATTHIEDADAATLVFTCGTEDKARDSLDGRVLSSVIAQMEKRSLPDARQKRSEIEHELLVALVPSFKKVGLTLDDISLTELTELDLGPAR